MGNLTGWHALILLAVVLLLFGAAKLPALARSLGESVKVFQKETRTTRGEADESDASTLRSAPDRPAAAAERS
jgi:sec-independent protein translocase protein TatA